MQRTRSVEWDIAKLILIYLVVLGHIIDWYTDNNWNMRALYVFIYTFHMPCFIFISGLFSKRNIEEKKYKNICSYLLIYILIRVLLCMAALLVQGRFVFHLFPQNDYSWYIFALFVFIWITIALQKIPTGFVLCIAVLFACLAGYQNYVTDTFALARIITFYPFFYLGYIADEQKVKTVLECRMAKICAVGVIGVAAFIIWWKIRDIYAIRALLTGRNSYQGLAAYGGAGRPEWVAFGGVFRLCYYPTVLLIGAAFFSIIFMMKKWFSGLSGIGKRTLAIYVFHFPVLQILYDKCDLRERTAEYGIPNYYIVGLAIAIVFFLGIPVWNKLLRKYLKCLNC